MFRSYFPSLKRRTPIAEIAAPAVRKGDTITIAAEVHERSPAGVTIALVNGRPVEIRDAEILSVKPRKAWTEQA